ncbi:MAG: hypothetical protein A2Z32_09760 [Chloroflexi bacterium RBG_16_69_14]|nr:MAG: hypothetical protein A2Z32_09760 [Chloroflexi bacterium RBG_16_69_14]
MSRQFVVQLENRPGELAHLARALGSRGIDIRHIASVGAGPLGCAFLTTSDDLATREVLRGLGHDYIEGDPVLVDVEDRPGGLADVLEQFASAGVNTFGSMIVGRRPGVVQMVFCVDDESRAWAALGQSSGRGVGVG